MKILSVKMRRLCVFVCLMLLPVLAACAKKENKENEPKSTELISGSFKLTLDGSFSQTSGKNQDEFTHYFGKNGGNTSLIIQTEYRNHASTDAAIDFLCSNIAQGYKVSKTDIKKEKTNDNEYYLFWNGDKSGKLLNCAAYVRFEEDSQLTAYYVDESAGTEEIRKELANIAENAVFTGKKLTVKDNYTIANTDFRIKISSNFDSPQLQDASSVDLSTDTIITGSDVIAVYYKAADSYERGDAYFKITPMKDQTKDIDEIAKEKANPVDAENDNLTKELTETTFGEVWPELTDSTVKSLKLYKITIVIKDNTFTAETYYFNINGRNYSAAVLYPYGDDDARKDLLNQFYNIEFIYAE